MLLTLLLHCLASCSLLTLPVRRFIAQPFAHTHAPIAFANYQGTNFYKYTSHSFFIFFAVDRKNCKFGRGWLGSMKFWFSIVSSLRLVAYVPQNARVIIDLGGGVEAGIFCMLASLCTVTVRYINVCSPAFLPIALWSLGYHVLYI